MYKKKNCLLISLLLLVSIFLLSCDVSALSGSANNSQSVDEDDLEAILYTISVFEDNYYANLLKFEGDDTFTVTNSNPLYDDYYKIETDINELQYKIIYERKTNFNTGIILNFNDWECSDFSLSQTFPHSPKQSYLDYFSDTDIQISNSIVIDFQKNAPSIVHSATDDTLQLIVNNKTYEIVFSYYYSTNTDIAIASLKIDDEDYSTQLKDFIELINTPDNDD